MAFFSRFARSTTGWRRFAPIRTRCERCPSDRPYFNLMAATPAKGHIFHWLFNAMVPLLAYLESGKRDPGLGLIVNAAESEIQRRSIDYLQEHYGIHAVVPVAQNEAVRVPHLHAVIPVPHIPRALQSPLGLGRLRNLGGFIAGQDGEELRKAHLCQQRRCPAETRLE